MIDINKVVSVYSGIDDRCCCGCSGKHWYPERVKNEGQRLRGYEIEVGEIDDTLIEAEEITDAQDRNSQG